MVRHEFWRQQYRANRYMEHCTERELNKRFEDILRNITELSDKGQISLTDRNYWVHLFTELQEELGLRGLGLPHRDLISPNAIPKPTYPRVPHAAAAIASLNLPEDYLVKYGKKKYLEKMFRTGNIRVAPASHYNDASLNSAIHDDESIISVEIHPSTITISPVSAKTGEKTPINALSNVKYQFKLKTNYYVICFAHTYKHRLFDDFEANACIVIKDVKLFLSKIRTAFAKAVDDWEFMFNAVRYVDPLKPPPEKAIDVFLNKHFRYAYQHEARAVWIPPNNETFLEPAFLEIGPMDSYAEFIEN